MTTELRELGPYDYIVYENKTDEKYPWSAYITSRPEIVVNAMTPVSAIQSLNIHFWHLRNDIQRTVTQCHNRMTKALRIAAGVPSWAAGLPSKLLFGYKKDERNIQRKRMDEILYRLEAENKGMKAAKLTDLILKEFNS